MRLSKYKLLNQKIMAMCSYKNHIGKYYLQETTHLDPIILTVRSLMFSPSFPSHFIQEQRKKLAPGNKETSRQKYNCFMN